MLKLWRNLNSGRVRMRSSDVPLFTLATIVSVWGGTAIGLSPRAAGMVGLSLGIVVLLILVSGRPIEKPIASGGSGKVDHPLYSFLQLFLLVAGMPIAFLAAVCAMASHSDATILLIAA